MATCKLCGKFNHDCTDIECPSCMKLWRRDIQNHRLPPPLDDPKDFPFELWLNIRCTERFMAKKGVSKEETLERVSEMAAKYIGYWDRIHRPITSPAAEDMKRIEEYYSY